MYSEALRILDRNTIEYMIDEYKRKAEEERRKNKELRALLAQYEQGKQ